jgi:hypothetical protein
MKYIYILFLATITASLAIAQENDSIIVVQSPSGRLSGLIDIQDLVNEGLNYYQDEFSGHWSGIEVGVNGFSRPDYSMYEAGDKDFLSNDLFMSNVLNLNILQYSKGLQSTRNTIGLVTGIGLSLRSYRLDNKTTIEKDAFGKVQPKTMFFDSNQKSKFSVVYIEVPLMVEFQIPVKHVADRLYFSTGINVQRRLSSHTKVKYRSDGKKQKLKTPGDYALRDFTFGGTVRVGYRWVNLFANYDFTPMFEDHRGPRLYPFSVGVRLISF